MQREFTRTSGRTFEQAGNECRRQARQPKVRSAGANRAFVAVATGSLPPTVSLAQWASRRATKQESATRRRLPGWRDRGCRHPAATLTGSALHTDWQRVVRLRRQSHEPPEDPACNARPTRSRSRNGAGMRMRSLPSAQTAGRKRGAMPSACGEDDVASCAAVVPRHDPCVSIRAGLSGRSVVARQPRAGALDALRDGKTDRWFPRHSIRRPRQEPGRTTRPVPAYREAAGGHLGSRPRKSYHCARAFLSRSTTCRPLISHAPPSRDLPGSPWQPPTRCLLPI